MTRVNLINPSELCRQHLVAEVHEIVRVFGLARKAQWDIMRGKVDIPSEYVLGTGHCKFLYNKLKFVHQRYLSLAQEMRNRGYNINQIPCEELLDKIDKKLYQDYTPTLEAIELSRKRIEERMPKE